MNGYVWNICGIFVDAGGTCLLLLSMALFHRWHLRIDRFVVWSSSEISPWKPYGNHMEAIWNMEAIWTCFTNMDSNWGLGFNGSHLSVAGISECLPSPQIKRFESCEACFRDFRDGDRIWKLWMEQSRNKNGKLATGDHLPIAAWWNLAWRPARPCLGKLKHVAPWRSPVIPCPCHPKTFPAEWRFSLVILVQPSNYPQTSSN